MHLDSVSALEDVQLAGVCDIKSDRAQLAEKNYSTSAYTDYKEMFAKEKPIGVRSTQYR